jgi:hypothetical protein
VLWSSTRSADRRAAGVVADIDEHDAVVIVELDDRDPHANQAQQSIEYGGRAHGL